MNPGGGGAPPNKQEDDESARSLREALRQRSGQTTEDSLNPEHSLSESPPVETSVQSMREQLVEIIQSALEIAQEASQRMDHKEQEEGDIVHANGDHSYRGGDDTTQRHNNARNNGSDNNGSSGDSSNASPSASSGR